VFTQWTPGEKGEACEKLYSNFADFKRAKLGQCGLINYGEDLKPGEGCSCHGRSKKKIRRREEGLKRKEKYKTFVSSKKSSGATRYYQHPGNHKWSKKGTPAGLKRLGKVPGGSWMDCGDPWKNSKTRENYGKVRGCQISKLCLKCLREPPGGSGLLGVPYLFSLLKKEKVCRGEKASWSKSPRHQGDKTNERPGKNLSPLLLHK